MRVCDIDNIFSISEIKKCIFSNGKFFVVANQRDRHKGIFLLEIDEDPFNTLSKSFMEKSKKDENMSNEKAEKRKSEKDTKFIINDVNLYDIGDVDMYCMEGQERDFN